ncbi:sushi, von Willebrand factor type A, EGF and pentraxin domain-containing protein 1-like isoform X3 [Dreissena polymorpha]|uniref:sushi, von Willebrand factor type A, EGF and pentraxin domain-containing protein 1-like isoform X3 n=1 Tax=Dreissena polymorpha TaxID=45954 RepID=UPI002263E527|nr:sushi, von Willebrand factor type A, EGF and pentraxin domain-containing protein 1-like isoform X3 [Dreissena polymorpha]
MYKLTTPNNTLYNAKVNVTCVPGYHLNQTQENHPNGTQRTDDVTEIITCEDTGNWSQISGCQPKDCGDPNTVLTKNMYTLTTPNNTLYNAKVNVTCVPGYHLNQTQENHQNGTQRTDDVTEIITCADTGNWSQISGCQPKDCGDPNTVLRNNMYKLTTPNNTLYNAKVNVTCVPGYHLNQTQENHPNGTQRTDDVTEIITCADTGNWSQISGCQPKDCGDPNTVLRNNMYKLTTPNNTLYNAKVNVTCVPGYHLNQTQENHPNGTQRTDDVTEIITCADTGNWSQISGCQPKDCGDPNTVLRNNMYKLTTPNNTLYNAKVNVTCVPGYHLNQTQENHPNGTQRTDDVTEIITCADTGNWSQISGCQPKDCGYPNTVLRNNMYELTPPNNTLYNAKVNVTCVPGYHLNQPQENHPNGTQRTDDVTEIITCAETGNWSQISGCQPKDCGDPNTVLRNNMYKLTTPNNTLYNAKVNVTCVPGYHLNQPQENHPNGTQRTDDVTEIITCADTGNWSQISGCQPKDCGDPNTVLRNNMYKLTTPNNTLYNAKANVTCVPGYHLNQPQENHPNGTQRTDDVTEIITCADTGNWSQISGCQPKDCGDPNTVLRNNMYKLTMPNNTLYNAKVNVTCVPGYHLNQTQQNHPNGTQRTDDVTEIITCADTGNWSQISGCQPKDCGDPNTVLRNNMYKLTMPNNTLYNAKVNVTCVPGYHLSQTQENHPNGTQRTNDVTEIITCADTGNWSQISGCQPKDCGDPNTVLRNNMYKLTMPNNTLYNAKVNVTCVPGYHLNQTQENHPNGTQRTDDVTEIITCADTGNWSQISGCQPKDCGDPNTVLRNNMYTLTTPNNTLYNAKVNVTCVPGYHLNQTQENHPNGTQRTDAVTEIITCADTGNWSQISGCQPKETIIEVSPGLTSRTPENTKVDVNEDSEHQTSESKCRVNIRKAITNLYKKLPS